MKVAFYTLGCKVNQYETDLMIEQFKENKFEIVDFKEKADVYVINSCSVTNLSTRKSRQAISKAKNLNKKAIVILVGCYTEELNFTENKFKLYDLALGNEEKKEIVKHVNEYIKTNFKANESKLVVKKDINNVKRYIQKVTVASIKEIRQTIKIEDGCNNFCSYCIIPYTRGRVRSRNLDEIIKEIKNLASKGVKEIVLVGIEIVSYGIDLENNISLIDVIEEINKIDGIERIRLGSLEPRWLTDETIERLTKVDKICNHFHISTQSLNNAVLKRMNRKYTKEYILDLTAKLKNKFNNISITTDLIVGYINETEEEFKDTCSMVSKIGFNDIHVFKFSKREHTRAYDMETTVTPEMSNLRSKELIKFGSDLKNEYLHNMLNKKYKILVEECKEGYIYGYTSNYIKVKTKGDEKLWGKIVEVELIEIEKGKDLILAKLV